MTAKCGKIVIKVIWGTTLSEFGLHSWHPCEVIQPFDLLTVSAVFFIGLKETLISGCQVELANKLNIRGDLKPRAL